MRKAPAAISPPEYEIADVAAIQAWIEGVASADQQRRAARFIIEKACGTYDQPFSLQDTRLTDFACGRMFVGQQIVKLSKLNIERLKEVERKKTNG